MNWGWEKFDGEAPHPTVHEDAEYEQVGHLTVLSGQSPGLQEWGPTRASAEALLAGLDIVIRHYKRIGEDVTAKELGIRRDALREAIR